MNPATDIFDSPRARCLISYLDVAQRPQGTAYYPFNLRDGANLRVADTETLRDWFRRVIRPDETEDRIIDCSIEDSFAFFGKVTWNDAVILECSFQALITKDTDLLSFYLEEGHEAQYYRFDVHPTQPGPLFAEPQPHIHSIPEGAPRFAISCEPREYCLV